ncbi:hypothetical protein [Caenispirillum salinarum]|uniref:hypothetical protein n=1 Tax=Caenispirillum salinarum TaxID=859058 RepID=UPI00384C7B3A
MEDRIAAILEGHLSPDNLSAEEHDVWLKAFNEKVIRPTTEEKEFFADRRRRRVGVGLSDQGTLISANCMPAVPNSEE